MNSDATRAIDTDRLSEQALIDLATRVQRRRDFNAHLTGFAVGAATITGLHLAGSRGTPQLAATLSTWAFALSFQHFRHVLRGPVTGADVRAESARLSH